ncbi:M14 family metallopeptidase [Granulosicoccus antarcticus]|uniref:succinylglutamate desuccinylase/aspartoacylase family protein n=1 Tax=Granulosicoccus antarcticus TaxID=437505 RepID=UPI001F2DA12F|nr:succinylglutamate desuccinylase/aspartoacylase family protein [Granulosicoccus antarcticus]
MVIGGKSIQPGQRCYVDLPLPPLYTHTSVAMPVHVIHGKQPGPVLFVTAAIHGDEINGIEIIRRLLATKSLSRLAGTLIAVPVVNVYGFVSQSRYLPDRRDLNRSFPGSETGSMAARLANTLMSEIVAKCTHGIDLHTAAEGRANFPQIRVDLDSHPELLPLAEAFAPPILVDSTTRDGTLRGAAGNLPLLLYEAGEALRFDDLAIRAGLKGVLNVMRHLKMLPANKSGERRGKPWLANNSAWMRAPQSGILRSRIRLGGIVEEGGVLGYISDPFGESEQAVISDASGVLIGITKLPLVHEGEALYHVATTESTKSAARAVHDFHLEYEQPVMKRLKY